MREVVVLLAPGARGAVRRAGIQEMRVLRAGPGKHRREWGKKQNRFVAGRCQQCGE